MNLQTLKQKTRLGNSGFSLVELIIVIAIMAILIAVLAPLFIRYVERSRISTDINALGSMGQALKTASTDPSIKPQATSLELVWDVGSGAVTVNATGGPGGTEYQDAVTDVVGGVLADNTEILPRSATVVAQGNVVIEMEDTSNGRIRVTSPTPGGTGADTTVDYYLNLLEDIN